MYTLRRDKVIETAKLEKMRKGEGQYQCCSGWDANCSVCVPFLSSPLRGVRFSKLIVNTLPVRLTGIFPCAILYTAVVAQFESLCFSSFVRV